MRGTILEKKLLDAMDNVLWSGRKGESKQEICVMYENEETAEAQLGLLGIHLMNIETTYVEVKGDRTYIGIASITDEVRNDVIEFVKKVALLVPSAIMCWDTSGDEIKELNASVIEEDELEEARQIYNDEAKQ